VLNKGATGVANKTPLHEDDNAVAIPGMWVSLKCCSKIVALKFKIPLKELIMKATLNRFSLFYGWIAHKTEYENNTIEDQEVDDDKMDDIRVHH